MTGCLQALANTGSLKKRAALLAKIKATWATFEPEMRAHLAEEEETVRPGCDHLTTMHAWLPPRRRHHLCLHVCMYFRACLQLPHLMRLHFNLEEYHDMERHLLAEAGGPAALAIMLPWFLFPMGPEHADTKAAFLGHLPGAARFALEKKVSTVALAPAPS